MGRFSGNGLLEPHMWQRRWGEGDVVGGRRKEGDSGGEADREAGLLTLRLPNPNDVRRGFGGRQRVGGGGVSRLHEHGVVFGGLRAGVGGVATSRAWCRLRRASCGCWGASRLREQVIISGGRHVWAGRQRQHEVERGIPSIAGCERSDGGCTSRIMGYKGGGGGCMGPWMPSLAF